MVFSVTEFLETPTVEEFELLKKDDLISLGLHFKLAVKSSMRKQEIKVPMSKWKAVHKQLLSLTSNSFLAVAKQFLSSSSMQMTVHLHSVAFMQISSP